MRYRVVSKLKRAFVLLVAVLFAGGLVPLPASAAPMVPEVVSRDIDNSIMQNISDIQISANGRYVAFQKGITSSGPDGVYVRDRVTQSSVLALGPQYEARAFKISGDGQKLFFTSIVGGIDPRTTPGTMYAYAKSLVNGQITLISVNSDNTASPAPSITRVDLVSDDGLKYVWQCNLAPEEICARDLASNTTTTYPFLGNPFLVSGDGHNLFYRPPHVQGQQASELRRYSSQTQDDTFIRLIPHNGLLRFTGASFDGNHVLFHDISSQQIQRLNLTTLQQDVVSAGNEPDDTNLSGDGTTAVFRQGLIGPMHSYNFETTGLKMLEVNSWGNGADFSSQSESGIIGNTIDFAGEVVVFDSLASNMGCSNVSEGPCGIAVSTDGPEIVGSDEDIPTTGEIDPNPITKDAQDTATFTMTAEDEISGVATGEFFLTENGVDPPTFAAATVITFPEFFVNGRGTPMTYDDGVLTGTIGTDVPPGEYTVRAYAQDVAGNWSEAAIARLVVTGIAPPETFTLSPVADTHVRNGQGNRNYGGEQFVRIQAGGDNRALMKFDQSEIVSLVDDGTLLSATLKLTITNNGNNWGASGRTVDIHRLLLDWSEGDGTEDDRGSGEGATWNCAPNIMIRLKVAVTAIKTRLRWAW